MLVFFKLNFSLVDLAFHSVRKILLCEIMDGKNEILVKFTKKYNTGHLILVVFQLVAG